MQHQQLNAPKTVLGLVNGMIGGLILILPLHALQAGWALTFIVIVITGGFSFFSCHLCLLHMGDQPDLDYAILKHFNGNKYMKVFYDICVWANLFLILLLYFELIVQQWTGLIPPYQFSIINPLVNSAVLLSFTFLLKYFQFGASIMAYGIISIIGYLFFLIWVIVTAPIGDTIYRPTSTNFVNLAVAMGQAFSIQSFFIPILKKNNNTLRYTFYTFIAYIIGASVYLYIAYLGSFGIICRNLGILNRKPRITPPQTIEDFFTTDAWQVKIIEAIYLVHLYSVFPEFLLISKKRCFGVLQLSESAKKSINWQQAIYVVTIIAICLTVGQLQVAINAIISINGAVIGFFFIYFLPALLHIKCLYFSRGKRNQQDMLRLRKATSENQDNIDNIPDHIYDHVQNIIPECTDPNRKQRHKTMIEISPIAVQPRSPQPISKEKDSSDQPEPDPQPIDNHLNQKLSPRHPAHPTIQNSFYQCNVIKQLIYRQVIDNVLLTIMVLMGAFIMINGIYVVSTS